MNKSNNYWPVYKNLEKEVLEITYCIHFCDAQLEVFSIKIAELIIRCAVEVESIAKQLYKDAGGVMHPLDESGNERYLNYDFDCLKLLDIRWNLGKKKIIVATKSMHFKEEKNRVLFPLKNAHKGDTAWQKAYQAIKHSRAENLHKANINVLVRAMAALYLLNIYYKNSVINAGDGYLNAISSGRHEQRIIDEPNFSANSELFLVSAFSLPMPFFPERQTIALIDNEHVYCKKMTDLSYVTSITMLQKKEKELKEQFLDEDINNAESNIYKHIHAYGFQIFSSGSYEFVVNKGQVIYD